MRTLFVAMSILAGLAAAPAQACTISPPGTPAEEARRAMERQTELSDEAATVFLAEIVEVRPVTIPGPAPGREVVLRPIQALQGTAPRRALTLRHTGYGTCGPSPGWHALLGEPGEVFAIFAARADPSQDEVVETVRRDRLVQPDLLAALGR